MNDHIEEKPIRSIEDAREFFFYMDCSLFQMGREYPERYEEYKKLSIPDQTENEWRRQVFDETCSSIRSNPDHGSLWMIHARLYDLYEALAGDDELMKILDVTKYIRNRLPPDDRVIVAETINGRGRRQDRDGLIYMAYDSGNLAAAKEFAGLSLELSRYNEENKWKFWDKRRARNQRATDLCRDIMNELGL